MSFLETLAQAGYGYVWWVISPSTQHVDLRTYACSYQLCICRENTPEH